jgi:hypothetical protein
VLAQRSWERRTQVAGMILYATLPLKPDMAVILRLLRQRPFSVLAGQVFGIASAQMRTIEQILFSPAFDPEKVKAYRSRLCLESPKAMAELFTRAPQKRADGDHRPALVVAGSDDWSIPRPSHEALAEAFLAFDRNSDLSVAVLYGDEGAFCAGADLSEATDADPRMAMVARTAELAALLRAIVECPRPVIAAVDGHVRAGGMGLVGACDIAIAGSRSTFALTEVRIGVAPAVISLTLLIACLWYDRGSRQEAGPAQGCRCQPGR